MSQRNLNSVKLAIISRMESHLPADPLDCKWRAANLVGLATIWWFF